MAGSLVNGPPDPSATTAGRIKRQRRRRVTLAGKEVQTHVLERSARPGGTGPGGTALSHQHRLGQGGSRVAHGQDRMDDLGLLAGQRAQKGHDLVDLRFGQFGAELG